MFKSRRPDQTSPSSDGSTLRFFTLGISAHLPLLTHGVTIASNVGVIEVNPTAVLEVLGGRKKFRGRFDTTLDLIDLGEKGLTKASLLELADFLEVSTAEMARLLPITERTIQRYSPSTRLSRAVSDHLLEIARAAVRGVDVFNDKEKFLAWMRRPNVALGNRRPMDLLASKLGIDLVIDELGRVEHGIVS